MVVKHSTGPCTFGHQSQKHPCYCLEGVWVTSTNLTDEGHPHCQECGHLIGLHQDYSPSAIQNPAPAPTRTKKLWRWQDSVCRRENTVAGLLKLVLQERVVQIRGTPTSGKTVLSELLHDHIQSTMPHLIPVYIIWRFPSEKELTMNPQYGHYEEWLRYLSRSQLPADFLSRDDVVLIIDEAQQSYVSYDFWMDCVKKQAQLGREIGPYLALFSSYGSADSTALKIEGSAPITLEQRQRVSLTPQPQIHHEISLCFTQDELRDVCTRITKGRYHIDEGIVKRIFLLTNGHPGLCDALLRSVIERPGARRPIKDGQVIYLKDVADFFDSDNALFHCAEERVRRSLPTREILDYAEYPNITDALRKAIEENGIIAQLDAVPGLISAYKRGYLQAEMVDEGVTAYLFPSDLHRRYCKSLIDPDSLGEVPFFTVKDLCFAAIPQFSPRQLRDHVRKAKHSAIKYAQNQVCGAQPPEAQYADELYRCLYKVTDGKCSISSELSYTDSGRIDFLFQSKSKSWGIEVLREGNRLQEHLDRFGEKGKYGLWDVVEDWILLDFRRSEPEPKMRWNDPRLFTIIFTPQNESFRIWDANHNEVIPPKKLYYR